MSNLPVASSVNCSKFDTALGCLTYCALGWVGACQDVRKLKEDVSCCLII